MLQVFHPVRVLIVDYLGWRKVVFARLPAFASLATSVYYLIYVATRDFRLMTFDCDLWLYCQDVRHSMQKSSCRCLTVAGQMRLSLTVTPTLPTLTVLTAPALVVTTLLV